MFDSEAVNKQTAVQFLQFVVAGKIDEAYEKFVDMKGKHHSAYFPAGFPALRDAMKTSHVQFPNKKFETKKVIGENDFVTALSHVQLQEGNKGFSVVHAFRFQNNKIVEMWDIIQPVPDNSPNKDGIF